MWWNEVEYNTVLKSKGDWETWVLNTVGSSGGGGLGLEASDFSTHAGCCLTRRLSLTCFRFCCHVAPALLFQALLEHPNSKDLLDISDRYDNTPLHIAAQKGYVSCVKVRANPTRGQVGRDPAGGGLTTRFKGRCSQHR